MCLLYILLFPMATHFEATEELELRSEFADFLEAFE
jgi:hypothetical protein